MITFKKIKLNKSKYKDLLDAISLFGTITGGILTRYLILRLVHSKKVEEASKIIINKYSNKEVDVDLVLPKKDINKKYQKFGTYNRKSEFDVYSKCLIEFVDNIQPLISRKDDFILSILMHDICMNQIFYRDGFIFISETGYNDILNKKVSVAIQKHTTNKRVPKYQKLLGIPETKYIKQSGTDVYENYENLVKTYSKYVIEKEPVIEV